MLKNVCHHFEYIYRSPQSYEPSAQVFTSNNHTQMRYFYCDQIGVPQKLMDENGNLCWYGDYLAWGMNLYLFEGTVQNQVDSLGLVVQVIAAP